MRIYIAGASAELERAERAIAEVRAMGHGVTHDWPAVIRKVRIQGGKSDADLTHDERRGHADDDLLAVANADALWLLVPEKPTSGAWVEFGFAVGRGWQSRAMAHTTIVVSGGHERALFCSLADEMFSTDDDALLWFAAEARQA